MRPVLDDDLYYRQNQSAYTKKLWQEGKYNHLIKPLVTRYCLNPQCRVTFQVKPHDHKKYCGNRCAALVTNQTKIRVKRPPTLCTSCGLATKVRGYKYCSLRCQSDDYYNQYIKRWKQGLESGTVGKRAICLSGHVRRYLHQKYKEQCSLCGWNKKNPITNRVPLEVDHIDGNSENNVEENLRIICPNCHSLTASFRNLNKGNGRAWRLKYIRESN